MYELCRYLELMTLTYISCSSDFYTLYVDVRYLLNYKAYNHQTLHNASPHCTDLAGSLTWWPWHIYHAAVTLTHFTSMFDISSIIRPTTTKHFIVLLLDVLTRQIPWPDDLDLYFVLHWLTHFTSSFDISSTISPTTTKPCIVLHLSVLNQQVPWPGNLDLYFTHQWVTYFMLTFCISSTIRPTTYIPCIVLFSMYWLSRYLDPVTLTYIPSSSDFYTFYDIPLSLSCIIQKVSAAYWGGRVVWRCRVSYVTGASNWYWLTVGQGLLSL